MQGQKYGRAIVTFILSTLYLVPIITGVNRALASAGRAPVLLTSGVVLALDALWALLLWRAARRQRGRRLWGGYALVLVVVVITALALRALAPEADTAQALFNLVWRFQIFGALVGLGGTEIIRVRQGGADQAT
jgi:peptidoglycan/LPS O-acetylase OafA/YrhL